MSSVKRAAGVTALVLAAFVVVLVAAIAVEFVFTRGRTPAIEGPDGRPVRGSIASLEKLRIGGVEQSVLIRGWDTTRPVLLFLHGGPGMPAMYLAHAFQRELERHFVVVHWDRRGAGKSYSALAPGESLGVRRVLDDTIELCDLLSARFGQPRILLVGHSWGSYLGVLASRERPDRFLAYVGEGEVFRMGGELYHGTSFWPLLRTGLMAPEYTLFDPLNIPRGSRHLQAVLSADVISGPIDQEVDSLAVPVFFFLGRHDLTTPSALAVSYLAKLRAPVKKAVWFEDSSHFPFFEEPDRFRKELVAAADTAASFWASVGDSAT